MRRFPRKATAAGLFCVFFLTACAAIFDPGESGRLTRPLRPRPILLVHGALASGAVFGDFARWLTKNGIPAGWVSAPDFPWTRCMKDYAGRIGEEVRKLRERSGRDKVVLICHSLGCGAALGYVNLYGGAPYVSHLVTLAGDNHGAPPRLWGLVSCATREMTPINSAYVQKMFRRGETRPGIRYCALQAGFDLILSRETTSLRGAKTIDIPYAGHGDIIFHRTAFRKVARECLRPRVASGPGRPR